MNNRHFILRVHKRQISLSPELNDISSKKIIHWGRKKHPQIQKNSPTSPSSSSNLCLIAMINRKGILYNCMAPNQVKLTFLLASQDSLVIPAISSPSMDDRLIYNMIIRSQNLLHLITHKSYLLDSILCPFRVMLYQFVAHLLHFRFVQFTIQLGHPRVKESEQFIDPKNTQKISY